MLPNASSRERSGAAWSSMSTCNSIMRSILRSVCEYETLRRKREWKRNRLSTNACRHRMADVHAMMRGNRRVKFRLARRSWDRRGSPITVTSGVSGRSGSHPLPLVSKSYELQIGCHGRSRRQWCHLPTSQLLQLRTVLSTTRLPEAVRPRVWYQWPNL